MQYNRNIVRVKQLLQCDANSRDGELCARLRWPSRQLLSARIVSLIRYWSTGASSV